MNDHGINQKNKIIKLCTLAWVVFILVVICVLTGILKDDSEKQQERTSADLQTTQNTTTEKPEIDKTQWNLMLVNPWHSLPENYNPTIKYLDNGHGIDERAYTDLQDMMDDCRAEGLNPLICSSYRTREKQEELFKNKVDRYLSYGYSQENAKKAAGELVAIPGTSEHQLGLALDIVDVSYQLLDEKQEDTPVQKWLLSNSWKYGFVLRYPNDKSEITGISYEPWHYRYVGKEASKKIYDKKICLEEYLNS